MKKDLEIMETTPPNVNWLLDYEITLSARYRRFVSLVMVTAEAAPREIDNVLSDAIRSSDVFFTENSGVSFIMGETGSAEAIKAINRFKKTINGSMNVYYSVASYPSDGKTMPEIKQAAQRRMDKAKTFGSGAIVAEG